MPEWIDAHNHLHDPRIAETAEVIKAMKASSIRQAVVNASHEDDWAAVESLANIHPQWITPCFGIHPWHAHHTTNGWQQRLINLLEKHPRAGIGECGLDGLDRSPAMAVQMPIFIDQLQIARTMARTPSIHCVKAWQPLFEALSISATPWFLMHGFSGSIESAHRLISLGAYFSCSGDILHPRRAKQLNLFRQLPLDRILLETDAPDMIPPPPFQSHPVGGGWNHPANLAAVGHEIALRLGIPVDDFAQQTSANASQLFG